MLRGELWQTYCPLEDAGVPTHQHQRKDSSCIQLYTGMYELYTVKTFWLLQPYFGHLSYMPVVCVTHYKLQRDASYLLKCS